MPLSKLQFKPGVNRENTNYAGEGGWFESEKIRFRSGYPEKIGGWQSISDTSLYTYDGTCRTIWNWGTLNGANLLALGTNQKLYIENGGAYYDITPWAGIAVTLGANPFATTSGSKLVTVTAAAHGASVGTHVTFSGATAVGGITISGEYEIISVPTGNTYTIIHSTAASSTATGGGASVSAHYQIAAGNAVYTQGTGWGAGAWSRGTWGSASSVGIGQQLRLWSLDNYGQDLIAAPRNGAIYYWAADTSTYAKAVTLESLANTAGYDGDFVPNETLQIIASDTQRFVIALGANPYDPLDSETAFDPLLIRWSDQENPYQWVPAIDNQSGEIRLGSGSTIVAGRFARQEILVWTDSTLYSVQYLGPPYVWGTNLLMDNISIISPNCMASASNITFWMGVDKFYMYDGRVQTLPSTVRQFVFDNLNSSQAYQIVAGTNEAFSEVWWHYPSANSDVNDSYVIYNYLDNAWYYGTLNRTAWLDSALRRLPMGGFSVEVSYLNAALNSSATSLTLVNGYTYPASGILVIGSEEIYYTEHTGNSFSGCTRGYNGTTAASHDAYDTAYYKARNQIMYHETGNDDGSVNPAVPFDAYIGSSDFDIGDGHNFGFIWRIIPDLTFDGSNTNNPQVTMVCRPRQFSGSAYGAPSAPDVVSAQNYNASQRTYPVQLYTGQVYTRIRGRQMAFKIESDGLGVAWQLGVPRIDIRPDGRR